MQTAQTEPTPAESTTQDLITQVNDIINENKTLNDVVEEQEKAQLQKENEDALNAIIQEQTKDIPSVGDADVKTDAVSSEEESNQLDEELKQ